MELRLALLLRGISVFSDQATVFLGKAKARGGIRPFLGNKGLAATGDDQRFKNRTAT
jgi:hypothetical protein